ncbi:tripartite tricarboxylate transporter substrate binding protein [Arthrobacter sp. H5]|uniref:tripartite tricarboxylate transporter substrate binding protein n=1 Tax=Arthrobacter sp. H5 TaxID=1267973 RepID=UPI0004BC1234|nr:tripartite tricarboxylate transporter substrate binding protein [Arthrobacter sp. H5]
MKSRRMFASIVGTIAVALAATGCGSGGGGADSAADFPQKRIDYVLPFDAGGESDITARLQQEKLAEILGQSVNVSYKPGGGGALGWSELTRTAADGYTVMGSNLPHIILQPMLRDDAGYETEDLQQVYIFQSTPNALLVPADSDIETLDDFIAAAEENPGAMSIGGSGDFSANHIGTLMLGDMAGIDITYTPFSGTGTAVPALLGGHVDALMSYSPQITQLGDQVRAIAVATEERMPGLPDVPTFAEQGHDLVDGAYRGISVPKGTPDDIVQKLADAFKTVNEDPELVKAFEEQAFVLENYGPEEAAELTKERTAVYEDLLTRLELVP